MDKTAVMNPADLRCVEQYLYEAGMEAQRKADPVMMKDQFGQEYIIAGGKVIEYVDEKQEKIEKPLPVSLSTLDGLIDYLESDPDHVFHDPQIRYMVIVESPTQINVISPETGYYKERMCYAHCIADAPNIALGRYMDTEDFQVMLQTCFCPTENLEKVLRLAGSVRKEQNLQTADDGVSQKVTINSGVTTASDVIIKNPVELIPFRTFHEVDQPASPFVLRFDQDGKAALFTGAGLEWKVEAKKKIAEYLRYRIESNVNVCVLS